MSAVLQMWTIYERPHDAPPGYPFVARKFEIRDGVKNAVLAPSWRYAIRIDVLRRGFLDHGMYRVPADPRDDPKIVESWI